MKPWLVVRFESQNSFPFTRPDRDRGTTGVAAVGLQDEAMWRGEHSSETLVYGVDSEADALHLQDFLISNYPRNTYLVAKTENVSYRPIGERVRARFTKEGLLPA